MFSNCSFVNLHQAFALRDPAKGRFENKINKKTLKQAWRFLS
jgi:hypothetical protein